MGLPGTTTDSEKDVIYTFGDCEIDTARFELSRGGQTSAVEPQVLELLIFLIDRRDRVVARDEMFETIWKGRVVSDATLSSRIKAARQAIGDDGTQQLYIKTIHGRGFRFVGKVEARDAAEPSKQASGHTASAVERRPVTRYAKSGDVHIAYHLFGEGPVNLVLTPGFVSNIDNYWDDPNLARWLTQLGRLARVAMFDKRGTGMSDRVSTLPGMDERMDDVRAVMEAVGFDTAYIMGISEGGSLATVFAAHYPQLCLGLILYGSFAQFRYWFSDGASLQRLFDYVESDWGSGKSLSQFAPSMADDAAFIEWWGKFERFGATPGGAIALMKMNSLIDISDILPTIHVPTLVIHRSNDILIDVEAGRHLAKHITGAKYLEIPGRDHLPWVGLNRDEIIEAIRSFVEGSEKPEAPSRVLATILLLWLDETAARDIATIEESTLRNAFKHFRATRIEQRAQALVATFDGPARALGCAVSLSRLLRRERLQYRMGIHTGEISLATDTLKGTAVDIAADVANHAGDNTIMVSRTVHDLVAGSGVELLDCEEHELRSISQAWRLFRVVE
jgi:pimeloyl-ACP methyl ester carboxylesterase